MADEAFPLQVLEVKEGVEPRGVVVHPRVELQEVDPLGAEPFQRSLHRLANVVAGDRPGLRCPLGEALGPVAEDPRDDLGRAVVVGHVEGGEAGVDIGAHGQGRLVHVELPAVAFEVRDLPQAVDDARDAQAFAERVAGNAGHDGLLRGHGLEMGVEIEALPP
jgi:hypothetical protein